MGTLNLNGSQRAKILGRTPCPSCRTMGEDSKGDNLVEYEDNYHCFACGHDQQKDLTTGKKYDTNYKYTTISKTNSIDYMMINNKNTNHKDVTNSMTISTPTTLQYVAWRGITRETMEFFRVKTEVDADGKPISIQFPYGDVGLKHRSIDDKKFWSTGNMHDAGLFGTDRFSAGSAKSCTITEGEIDALSVYQMLGSKYPVFSVRGSDAAQRDCQLNYSYLSQFDTIYICFDNDAPGQKAIATVAKLFDPTKLRIVKLSKYKDANEYLVAGEVQEFRNIWFSAKMYLPKEIISGKAAIEEILDKEDQGAVATYPFRTLDTMAYGIRSGELVLFTAQQKVGKTEVLRAIEHHLLSTTKYNIGIIHLEENEKRTIQGLASYELNVPVHLPDSVVSKQDVKDAYAKLTGVDNNRVYLYSSFGSNDPETILDRIRYLVTVCNCKFIFLDHMTRLVSSNMEDDLRRTLDYLATTFAIMCKELDFTLFLVCHVNDEGQPRDSRMIAKECNLHVYFSRDKESGDAAARNTVAVMVRDNRFSGSTGPAGELVFDPKTFKLTEKPYVVDMDVTYDTTL